MISLNSSSLILLSINASDICEAIVFNLALANVLIIKCFSALIVVFFTTLLPINEMNPVAIAPISKPKAMGTATTVDNKATPVAPAPIEIVIKTLSTLLVILAIRKYFY